MDKRKTKVYTYTRVSTAMQIDGYSLDAQKSRMKAFAEYNDYEIVREYEDAGKSGKSIEGRVQFSQMMDDIKEGKDGVSYVLVFKLSRFGRNAADVLSTLQIMQDFGVNLICVEDGIDSSKDAGKLMISVLSAVAEIERENIRVQTMEGRIQKAREGKWNGGFAPYGYQLVDGKLEINEEEAVAIRVIFDQYVNTNIGSNGIAKYLENHGIRKIQRQNGKNPLFDAHLVRLILRNPVYCGKIAYGRRRTEKVHGTRNDYHLVEQENYLLVDGLHEAIVSEEVWQAAQVKLLAQAKKYEHVNKGKDTKTHLLSGIVKCPVCGAGMYGNKCIKHKKDGTKYKDFYYYGCKHRTMTRGHKCDYRKQINEELLDDAVAEIIVALVSKPKFATMMQEKINMKVDTSTIDQEVANHEKQLRQYYSTKSKLMEEIDSLDPDDRHYIKRKADLDDRLYRMYDKIEEEENLLVEARAKKQAIEAEKLTADNIYKVLIYFEKLYGVMNDVERRRFIEALISEIQIFPERQPNGQWLKSIKFKLPIIGENMELSLDNDKHVEMAAAVLDNLGWRTSDVYRVLALEACQRDSIDQTLSNLQIQIFEDQLKGKAFLYEDQLVVLINETAVFSSCEDGENRELRFRRTVKKILQQFESSGGYSESFLNLRHFRTYYLQAKAAREYACRSGKSCQLLSYAKMAVPYLAAALYAHVPPELVCHPAVAALRQYDRDNHAELLHTLRCYLEHEQNTQKTAQALYIHRNSLLYRLERIQQLTAVDLSSPEERLRLSLSFFAPEPVEE